jgi:hypothetical protein
MTRRAPEPIIGWPAPGDPDPAAAAALRRMIRALAREAVRREDAVPGLDPGIQPAHDPDPPGEADAHDHRRDLRPL